MRMMVNFKGTDGVRRALFYDNEDLSCVLLEGFPPEIKENGYVASKTFRPNSSLRETFETHNFNHIVQVLRMHVGQTRNNVEQELLKPSEASAPSMPSLTSSPDADGVITIHHDPDHPLCRALNSVYDDLLYKTMVEVWNKTVSERKQPVTAGNGAAGASARASDASTSSVAQPGSSSGLGKRTSREDPIVIDDDTESDSDEGL